MHKIVKTIFQETTFKSLLVVLFANLLVLINYFFDWPLVKFAKLRPQSDFIDLSAVLKSIECMQIQNQNIPLDIAYKNCNYLYGSKLISAGSYFNLNSSNTNIFAWVLLVLTCSMLGLLLNSTSLKPKEVMFLALVLTSPAISLLFERANIDTLVFILISLAAWLYATKWKFCSFIILSISALIKFYTLPLLLLIILVNLNKRNFFVLFFIGISTSIIVVTDLTRIEKIPSYGFAQFGASVFSWYFDLLGLQINKLLWLIFGVLITVSLAICLGKIPRNFVPALDKKHNFIHSTATETIQIWFSLIFLFCFLSGYNYDYRLIFLAGGGPVLLRVGTSGKAAKFWIIIFALTLWCSIGIGVTHNGSADLVSYLFLLIQLFGDIATLLWASYLLAFFWKSLSQLLKLNYI